MNRTAGVPPPAVPSGRAAARRGRSRRCYTGTSASLTPVMAVHGTHERLRDGRVRDDDAFAADSLIVLFEVLPEPRAVRA